MKKYKLVSKQGEGTFSEVVKAENIENGNFYAIKCMKNSFKSLQQVNNLREIQALRKLAPHPNIVNLEEVLFDEPTGRLAMVFELMDANLYDLISGRRGHLDPEIVRSIGYQMFVALNYMHERSIFHRDIKPENILIDKGGKTLKLADFGSCRSIHSKPPFTEYIATRWYRSPECLLTEGHYGAPMDMWGAGCVLFEITALFPLFPGADEVDQINRIHKVVGTPSKEMLAKFKKNKSSKIDFKFRSQNGVGIRHFIPHASPESIDLLNQTLEYDYAERIGSRAACDHEYFDSLRDQNTNGPKNATVPTSSHPKQELKKEERNERSSRRLKEAQETSESKLKQKRIVKAHKPKSDARVTKPKVNPNKSVSKPANSKKVRPTDKAKVSSNTKSSRLRLALSKSKSNEEEPKRSTQSLHNKRLPKLDHNNIKKTKKTKATSPSSNEENKPVKPVRRTNNKYSNITSTGYGRSNYKPTKTKTASTNPSANSTLTDRTSKTVGTSSYISSKNLPANDTSKDKKYIKGISSKASKKSSSYPKKQISRREKTLSQLPAVK